MLKIIKNIRTFWLALLGLIVLFFAYQLVSPTGAWTCSQDFSRNYYGLLSGSSCLGSASPSERVARSQNGPLLVLAEPVYFSVFSPRAFSRAEVEISYRPQLSSATPIFEAGFLADKKLWRYQLQPVYNLWLERGLAGWHEVADGNLRLWQRQSKFDSISDFLSTWRRAGVCTSGSCLAVYNLDLTQMPPALNLANLNQVKSDSIFPYALRGAHQFYLYSPDGQLELSGSIQDLNNNKDRDDAEILVFAGQHQIAQVSLPDQRPELEESGNISSAQAFKLSKKDLNPGLYRVEFKAGDDLILASFRSASMYLSAINKVWPVTDGPVSLLTDASYLQLKAVDPVALQTVVLGQASLEMKEIYRQYELRHRVNGVQAVTLERGGVVLENNGVFAGSAESLLNPDYPRFDRFAPLAEQLDFVLAEYNLSSVGEDGWLTSSLDFAVSDFYRENGRYSLILSVPGLNLDNGAGGLIEIKEIRVRFYGKSLWEKLRELVLN